MNSPSINPHPSERHVFSMECCVPVLGGGEGSDSEGRWTRGMAFARASKGRRSIDDGDEDSGKTRHISCDGWTEPDSLSIQTLEADVRITGRARPLASSVIETPVGRDDHTMCKVHRDRDTQPRSHSKNEIMLMAVTASNGLPSDDMRMDSIFSPTLDSGLISRG